MSENVLLLLVCLSGFCLVAGIEESPSEISRKALQSIAGAHEGPRISLPGASPGYKPSVIPHPEAYGQMSLPLQEDFIKKGNTCDYLKKILFTRVLHDVPAKYLPDLKYFEEYIPVCAVRFHQKLQKTMAEDIAKHHGEELRRSLDLQTRYLGKRWNCSGLMQILDSISEISQADSRTEQLIKPMSNRILTPLCDTKSQEYQALKLLQQMFQKEQVEFIANHYGEELKRSPEQQNWYLQLGWNCSGLMQILDTVTEPSQSESYSGYTTLDRILTPLCDTNKSQEHQALKPFLKIPPSQLRDTPQPPLLPNLSDEFKESLKLQEMFIKEGGSCRSLVGLCYDPELPLPLQEVIPMCASELVRFTSTPAQQNLTEVNQTTPTVLVIADQQKVNQSVTNLPTMSHLMS